MEFPGRRKGQNHETAWHAGHVDESRKKVEEAGGGREPECWVWA